MAKLGETSNVVRIGPSSERGADSASSNADASLKREAMALLRKYMSAIKIIMISAITEASDFLSEYENYKNTASVISGNDDRLLFGETAFYSNPMKAWGELFIALVMVYKSFPNTDVTTEIVESAKTRYDGERSVDNYFIVSFPMVTESYDWKSHFVEILIPHGTAAGKTIVVIDNEPVFVLD